MKGYTKALLTEALPLILLPVVFNKSKNGTNSSVQCHAVVLLNYIPEYSGNIRKTREDLGGTVFFYFKINAIYLNVPCLSISIIFSCCWTLTQDALKAWQVGLAGKGMESGLRLKSE